MHISLDANKVLYTSFLSFLYSQRENGEDKYTAEARDWEVG